jgi:3-oxoacyl-(acyl-carrier-protein) synthase/thioesterase domain-containing protein/SAM-dependent methyltransferase/acyl carrier protein
MKRLLLDFLWSHLHALGAFRESGQTLAAARQAAGLAPGYEAWFAESVRVLEGAGYLERRDGRIITGVDRHRPIERLWREWAAESPRWQGNPDLAATHLLVETALKEFPDILTGRRKATEVMFPGGSMQLVENAYKTNPASEFFNRALAATLVASLRAATDEPRILEIGAGTGATSEVVLDAVRAAGLTPREYCYTDISRAFLDHAQRSYSQANPFLTYRLLDVERPVAEQEIPVHGYDVVIAANVLHATRDIRESVRNAKATIKPGGLLLLNELVANNLLSQFTFGLLEGWWRYEDAEIRIPGSPLLSTASWRRVLTEEGFGPVTTPVGEAEDLGQQIIAARSDGVVRQTGTAAREPRRDQAAAIAPPSPASVVPPAGQLLATVEGVVLDVLAESLRIDRTRIARDVPFSDYGLDSIFAVNVARAVGRELDIDLDITVLFEHSTLADLGAFIVAEYADELPVPAGEPEHPEPDPVPADAMAIVGMSARFPQAEDIEEFWRVVEQGRRCITTPPTRRADWARHSGDAHTDTLWGGFLDGAHEFDPLFFTMSMTEARQVTPELRLMLMAAWNAVEDAGYRLAELRTRSTGVFIAAGQSEYRSETPEDGPSLLSMPSPAMIPNRISYLFDLRGPSEQYDTTCSSSFVALHRAIRSIRAGECEQALVGGVNLVMSPAGFAGMRAAGMLSAGGNVRPFQQDADGTVRSEGVGAVLLKPLARAVEDGDFVYGVVRGTGVAHGGRGVSLTAPNIRGMKTAIANAYADAGIDPGTVSYVETHGMSSVLADSAEIAALGASLRGVTTPDDSPVYLGSVKPCIGHTEVSSGMAALVKTVQAMRRGVIPAVPGFTRTHEDISLDGTRLKVATENTPWPVRTGDDGRPLPRRAGMNSFGIGGVNAHVVLEQHLQVEIVGNGEDTASPQLLVLSARTDEALLERARGLADWLKHAEAESLADIAYTLQLGREAMDRRLALVAETAEEAIQLLDSWLTDDQDPARRVILFGDTPRDSIALERLAYRWVAGEHVDWEPLHRGTRRRRVPLPGYPFARQPCSGPRTPIAEHDGGAFVTELVASVLGLDRRDIDSTRSLADHGLNSLLLVAMLGQVRGEFPAFQPDWLRPHDTLDDVVARLSTMDVQRPAGPRFPELLHLNNVTRGRPVFWIHGALASVEAYRTIAERVDRPFYGIQARGFMTDDQPVAGIPKMADYYLDIVRSVQPEGPYDLGGFCLGGIVAYEMTRLLQERGETVASLTMVDSPDNTGLANSNATGSMSMHSAALQVVNSLLWPVGEKDSTALRASLIHQDEVAGDLDEDAFVSRLAELAAKRGFAMAPEQLIDFVRRNIGVQLAYRLGEYRIQPLARPKAVDCTYFRNRRGTYLGDLEPYFQVAGETFSLDNVDYWQDWERELPGWRVVDIDAANHMTILHDDGPLAVIEQACVEVYRADERVF